ncbi:MULTISPECIES: hypothetical protein [unclassified Bacillus (in: firmicutes)]|uniref:hypothetical protein n=1 Tax=unclassified Bacillus (in: firmicutes) TaxID=185979 RepID=UPI001BE8C1AB|nr:MULTISPECIES: hypothetical protein [unclassified Bacillus (in: firmicutes)]MBT2616963.1 hypothetical protein [Bacillus sp. ISL-78]MBT2628325.1 hypothetical protein [Bacillus sp. ISL-101]MBT2714837.1 hypothetical protein [Bacillus sp. ISL-57]
MQKSTKDNCLPFATDDKASKKEKSPQKIERSGWLEMLKKPPRLIKIGQGERIVILKYIFICAKRYVNQV